MKRSDFFWYALDSVFVIVFLVFFFTLAGTDNVASVWISFGSILLSYALLLATPFFVRKGPAQADYRRPLFVASSAYFFVTFIFGLLIMLIKPEKHTAVLLVNVAFFGIYAVFLLMNLLANEHTADQQERREEELKYVKDAAVLLRSMVGTAKDKNLSKKIEEAYDIVSTSPAKSSPSVKALEESILQEIKDCMAMDPVAEVTDMMKSMELVVSMAKKRNVKLQTEN